ncbi:MAG: phage head closure protein [Candidatus Paceibacterota bacterium]|jgi:SPP1 family predicted phage head-tail adaptor
MNPGDLRSRIIIEEATYTDNGFGGKITTWTTLATVWAKVEHLSGRELQIAQLISPNILYEITIRYRSDMSTQYRIYYSGQYFNIRDIKDLDNMHKWLYLKCEVRESEQ